MRLSRVLASLQRHGVDVALQMRRPTRGRLVGGSARRVGISAAVLTGSDWSVRVAPHTWTRVSPLPGSGSPVSGQPGDLDVWKAKPQKVGNHEKKRSRPSRWSGSEVGEVEVFFRSPLCGSRPLFGTPSGSRVKRVTFGRRRQYESQRMYKARSLGAGKVDANRGRHRGAKTR